MVVSRIGGYAFLEHCSFDAYNESTLLQQQIEQYYQRFGYYLQAVLADKLYRTRENMRYCAERNVRLSGDRLGKIAHDGTYDRTVEKNDTGLRNSIEGTFGTEKRKYGLEYGLGRIMMKLANTSESSIAMIILVMNLEKRLKYIFMLIRYRCFHLFKLLFSMQFQQI